MFTTFARAGALAIATGFVVVACSTHDNTATRSDTASGSIAASDTNGNRMAAASAAGTTSTAGTTGAAHNGWTDAQIVAFTSAANIAEIQEGKLGAQKATSPAVKAFAKQLETDHQTMLTQGKEFASKNNIVPDTTKDDVKDAVKDAHDEYQDLQSKKAGKDWDEDFVEKQIDGHQKTLDKINQAAQATTNPQLKDMLTKAAGKVQEHLTKAQSLKSSMKS